MYRPSKGWLLGDSAYPLPSWLLTTILNPVGRPQRRYNSAHCKTRVKIEHMFGIWKIRLRCLHKGGGGGSMMFRPKHCDPLYCGGGSNSIPQLLYCTTLEGLSMVHRQNNRCHDYLRD